MIEYRRVQESPADRGPETSPEIAVTPRRAAAPPGVPRDAGDGGAAAAGTRGRRLRRCTRRHSRRQASWPWIAALAEPGEGRSDRARPARLAFGRRCARRRRRSRRRRRLRPVDQAARARRNCRWSTCTSHCCRGGAARHRWNARCWPATRETGVCLMQLEEGSTPGPSTPATRADRPHDHGRRAARRAGRRRHTAADRRVASGLGSAAAAGRRADLRGQAAQPRNCRSTGLGHPTTSSDSCDSVARGRRCTGDG